MQKGKVIWIAEEEVLQPKQIIDNHLIYAIKDQDDNPTVGTNSSRPRSTLARLKTLMDRMMNLEIRFDQFTQYQMSAKNTIIHLLTRFATSMSLDAI